MKKLKQTHGAILNEEDDVINSFKPRPKNKFNVAHKFKEKLGSMTLDELQSIAEEMNIIPIDNRDLLIASIKKELKNTDS